MRYTGPPTVFQIHYTYAQRTILFFSLTRIKTITERKSGNNEGGVHKKVNGVWGARERQREHTGAVKSDKLPRQNIVKEKGEVSKTMNEWEESGTKGT